MSRALSRKAEADLDALSFTLRRLGECVRSYGVGYHALSDRLGDWAVKVALSTTVPGAREVAGTLAVMLMDCLPKPELRYPDDPSELVPRREIEP
ncbi:MAG TPA: hypothetical protein VGA23_01090 [Methylomirabilota bacterium]